jgi:hypothetical protein
MNDADVRQTASAAASENQGHGLAVRRRHLLTAYLSTQTSWRPVYAPAFTNLMYDGLHFRVLGMWSATWKRYFDL